MTRARIIAALAAVAVVAACAAAIAWRLGSPATAALPDEDAIFDELLARIDGDRDGRISRAEYDRYSNRRDAFERLDRDGDGFAGPSELKQAVLSADPGYRKNFPARPPTGP